MKKHVLLSIFISIFLPSIAFSYPVYLEDFTGDDALVVMEITGDGTSSITFEVTVLDPEFADLSGIFLNFDPFPLSPSNISVYGDYITGFTILEDSVDDLGDGVVIEPEGPFDAGIKIGFAGDDGITSTSFTIESTEEDLYLGDFFGARLKSIGVDGEGSSKLVGGVAPVPEPATILLFGTGLIGLAVTGRKKIKK